MQSICTPNSPAGVWCLTAAGCWAMTASGLALQGCSCPALLLHPLCLAPCALPSLAALSQQQPAVPAAALGTPRAQTCKLPHQVTQDPQSLPRVFNYSGHSAYPEEAPGQLHHSNNKHCTQKAKTSCYLKP